MDDLLLSDSKAQDLDLSEDITGSEESTGSKSQFDSPELQNLLANPLNLPQAEILAPATPPDLASEVTFLNQVYEGRHVVYVLDAGLYMLKGEGASESFEAMKDALLSSIVELSPNSFFNLVLFWNLREASALGKTILRANQENKKFAIDWIAGLGSDPEKLKDRRNQFYPKELLYAKPLAGLWVLDMVLRRPLVMIPTWSLSSLVIFLPFLWMKYRCLIFRNSIYEIWVCPVLEIIHSEWADGSKF